MISLYALGGHGGWQDGAAMELRIFTRDLLMFPTLG